jgi:hypothetical protein
VTAVANLVESDDACEETTANDQETTANDQPAVVAERDRRPALGVIEPAALDPSGGHVMGEGVAPVVATDREGTRVQTLSQEIARMRIRLTAVASELDRRRHNATDVKHRAREHAGAVAAGALVLAAIVATPVLKVRRRRQRRWAHQGVTLIDRARRLGRALGRVAHDPDRLVAQPPPRMLGIPLKTLAALLKTLAALLTAAQILADIMRERRRRNEAAPRRDGRHPGRATDVATAPAPDGSRLPPWSSP